MVKQEHFSRCCVLGMAASSAILLRLRASRGSIRRQLAKARSELDTLRIDTAEADMP